MYFVNLAAALVTLLLIVAAGPSPAQDAGSGDSSQQSPPTTETPKENESPSTPAIKQETLPPEKPDLTLFTVRRKGHHKGYSLDVRYPQFKGQPVALVRLLNHRIKQVVNQNICADPNTTGGGDFYSCDYKCHLLTSDLLSIDFEFQGVPGTKRGRYYHVPLNCSLYPSFKQLTLRSLIGRRLTTAQLSDLCIPKLKQTLKDALSLPANTNLDREAFSAFTFDKKAITFYLPEGYVAATALTCPEAKIPYHDMRRYIRSRSPVYEYVSRSKKPLAHHRAEPPETNTESSHSPSHGKYWYPARTYEVSPDYTSRGNIRSSGSRKDLGDFLKGKKDSMNGYDAIRQ